MWRRYLVLFFIVTLLILIQTSFGTSWAWQNKINIILLFVLTAVLFGSLNYGLFWVVLCGYFLDLFSMLNFGLMTMALLVAVIIVYLIAKNFITYNNWWSISLLVAIGTFMYNLFLVCVSWLLWRLQFSDFFLGFDGEAILWQLVINIGLVIIIHFFRNFLRKYLIVYESK